MKKGLGHVMLSAAKHLWLAIGIRWPLSCFPFAALRAAAHARSMTGPGRLLLAGPNPFKLLLSTFTSVGAKVTDSEHEVSLAV